MVHAVVEQVPMIHIPIGNVGVVNSVVGAPGKDISGVEFAHGNIVEKGRRGVWNVPLIRANMLLMRIHTQ